MGKNILENPTFPSMADLTIIPKCENESCIHGNLLSFQKVER